MRSATDLLKMPEYHVTISIHALHAECDWPFSVPHITPMISIHALHAECDKTTVVMPTMFKSFQSTHSMRSATNSVTVEFSSVIISIHALHAECD